MLGFCLCKKKKNCWWPVLKKIKQECRVWAVIGVWDGTPNSSGPVERPASFGIWDPPGNDCLLKTSWLDDTTSQRKVRKEFDSDWKEERGGSSKEDLVWWMVMGAKGQTCWSNGSWHHTFWLSSRVLEKAHDFSATWPATPHHTQHLGRLRVVKSVLTAGLVTSPRKAFTEWERWCLPCKDPLRLLSRKEKKETWARTTKGAWGAVFPDGRHCYLCR